MTHHWIPEIEATAREAGACLATHFANLKNLTVERKPEAGNSPVTIADKEAEEIIRTRLFRLAPDVPFVGEESYQDVATHHDLSKPFWLVDPMDGTKNFVENNSDFTVNIALIDGRRPVLGVVYAPMLDEMYIGNVPANHATLNGRIIKTAMRAAPERGMLGYTTRYTPESLSDIFHAYGIQMHNVVQRGSSLRLCAVAKGDTDVYPQLFEANEWDVGAAEAVLLGAGGVMRDFAGGVVQYGQMARAFKVPRLQIVAQQDFLRSGLDQIRLEKITL